MKIKSLTCSIFFIIIWMAYAYADGMNKDIVVSNAWVQAMPPSQKTTAAYMTIVNNTKGQVILESASSDIAGATEIHQMSDMNGMMHMAMAAHLQIPAQAQVTLQPGGFHLMLINLKKPVNKGDIVPITLHFKGLNSIIVDAKVHDQ